MNRLNEWQLSECATLNCTVDEHNKLLRAAHAMDMGMGRNDAYDSIKAAIVKRQVKGWCFDLEKE